MKKMLLISGALLAVMATSAMANGLLGLHVNDCNGVSVINNNCATNTGAVVLVASVQPPAAVPQFQAVEFVIDCAQAGAGPISAWWNMDPGTGCASRVASLTTSFDFTTLDANGNPVYTACSDPWGGAASGGIGIVLPSTGTGIGPASARITGVGAIAGQSPLLAGPTEYYMMFVKINKAGQLSSAATCGGCLTATNIVLNNIKLIQPAGVGDTNVSGDGSARQQCSYNGGNTPTEAKKTSWGSIKALYR
jgi:hypothetical protein